MECRWPFLNDQTISIEGSRKELLLGENPRPVLSVKDRNIGERILIDAGVGLVGIFEYDMLNCLLLRCRFPYEPLNLDDWCTRTFLKGAFHSLERFYDLLETPNLKRLY